MKREGYKKLNDEYMPISKYVLTFRQLIRKLPSHILPIFNWNFALFSEAVHTLENFFLSSFICDIFLMAFLVVGEEGKKIKIFAKNCLINIFGSILGCEIPTIVEIMMKSPAKSILWDNWSSVSISLGFNDEDISRIRRDITNYTTEALYVKISTVWVSAYGDNRATL